MTLMSGIGLIEKKAFWPLLWVVRRIMVSKVVANALFLKINMPYAKNAVIVGFNNVENQTTCINKILDCLSVR
ncbi:hypothetical protein MTsPCn5_01840 [Croceitalea sp. MTPC5]|nr:hypothetical protein MTsPCn5_01840 [Croceitalea sp. MTPC5]